MGIITNYHEAVLQQAHQDKIDSEEREREEQEASQKAHRRAMLEDLSIYGNNCPYKVIINH